MRVRTLLVSVGAAVALFATGCTGTPEPAATPTPGLEAEDAEAIFEAANESLFAAESFRARGSGEVDGEEIEMDVVFAGDNMQGTLTAAGITFEMLMVDGDSYFKGDEELWSGFLGEEELALVLPLLSGKWVKLPGSQGFDLEPRDLLEPTGELTKGEITEVDGTRAIVVSDEEGDYYISLEGEPYLLQYVSDEGTVEITDIGESVTIEAPDASEVFDLSSFTG